MEELNDHALPITETSQLNAGAETEPVEGVFKGPIDDMKKIFSTYKEPQFIFGRTLYSAEKLSDDTTIVRKIGKLSLEEVLSGYHHK